MGKARVRLVTCGSVATIALAGFACSEDGGSDGSDGTDGLETSSGGSGGSGGASTASGAGGASSGTPTTTAGGSSAGGSSSTEGSSTEGTSTEGTSSGTGGGTGGTGGSTGDTSSDAGGSGGVSSTTAGGGSAGTGGTPTTAPPSCEAPSWDPADFDAVYDVGPDQDYETPSDVPWESLTPSSLVRIHWRDTPYADKWVVAVAATEDAPVVILGVPNDGQLPRIVGAGATTRAELDYWSGTRGIIKIGGSSVPDLQTAEHVFIECLDLSGARTGNTFSNAEGDAESYDDNASAIFLESGSRITLRNNVMHDSGNGLFIAHESSDIVVSGNHLFDNGNASSAYEHNSYTEARGITFEFNRYGALCEGCDGNNLKDRSSGLVVRYNFIEGGNRALDLVDSAFDEINGSSDYHDSFVYGNVLIELDGGNRQIVHYGGDNSDEFFRKGTLHFYHNTVISERSGLASVVRLSSADATIDARNNVFFASVGSDLALLEDAGTAVLSGNWLPTGWQQGSPSLSGSVSAMDNVEGSDPGFLDAAAHDFRLGAGSAAAGIVVPLAAAASDHPVSAQYPIAGNSERASADDAGAFE